MRKGDVKPDGPASVCNLCLPVALARAFDQAGQADSAIAYYERVLTQYSFDHLTFDWYTQAPYAKRLGELYEQAGNREKAARYYRDFVNLWKNADPELQPQVAEVRRRLSRIADIEKKP